MVALSWDLTIMLYTIIARFGPNHRYRL